MKIAGALGAAVAIVTALVRVPMAATPAPITFADATAAAGINFIHNSGRAGQKFLPETMGSGGAFVDLNGDGWPDIVLVNSRDWKPRPGKRSLSALYRNNGNGTFTNVTAASGLDVEMYGMGIAAGDFDNDGRDDLYITSLEGDRLFHNEGNFKFRDVTKTAGIVNANFGTSAAWFDYDRDGRLDLFVSNYLVFDQDAVPRAGASGSCDYYGVPVSCGPRGLPYGHHSLYHNNGDGTFTDVTVAAGIAKPSGGYGLTAIAADLDNDGWPDIFVACDSTPSLYFRNNHDGTFTEQAIESGIALSDDGMEQAGMGVAVGDFKLDGNLHLIKTHFSHDTSAVYLNDGKGNFSDASLQSGLGVETRFVNWGIGITDLDNDGNPDVFMVSGGIYPEVDKKLPDAPRKTPRVIFRNLGKGQFEELIGQAGPGIDQPHCSRGCAFGDFDNDGDMDVLIVNQNEPPSLLRNDLTGSHRWIKIKLTGVQSNRSAIGARVTVHYGDKVQSQEVLSQSSYLSVNDSRLHFGLGSVAVVDIEIRWPLGQVERLKQVPAGQLIYVAEGSGITRTQKFTRE